MLDCTFLHAACGVWQSPILLVALFAGWSARLLGNNVCPLSVQSTGTGLLSGINGPVLQAKLAQEAGDDAAATTLLAQTVDVTPVMAHQLVVELRKQASICSMAFQ